MPGVSRRLLERAAGYVVYGSDGRRVGKLIELVARGEEGADSVAIRCERIFFWRRRTVPIAAVARVDPEERTVTLRLDEAAIERAHESQAGAIREGSAADLIARYGGAVGAEADAPAIDADTPAPAPRPDGSDALAAASADGSQSAGADAADELALGRHLLFVPTTAGYALLERNGEPPPCPGTIKLCDPPGSFAVVKLAPSPLPNDERRCAYLDRLD
jgi:hypothetical protein